MRSCVRDGINWSIFWRIIRSGQKFCPKKEQDTLRDMRIVQEMYARGFTFTPIDIYKAKARRIFRSSTES